MIPAFAKTIKKFNDDKNNITNIRYQNLYHKSMMDDTVDDSESRLVQETKGIQRINYLYNMNGNVTVRRRTPNYCPLTNRVNAHY